MKRGVVSYNMICNCSLFCYNNTDLSPYSCCKEFRYKLNNKNHGEMQDLIIPKCVATNLKHIKKGTNHLFSNMAILTSIIISKVTLKD